jgi:hypothetical protein
MPARTEWDNEEKTVLLHIYEDDVTLEDYHRIIDESYELISAQPHPVHTIMLRTNVKSQPAALLSVMRYANKHLPDNQGIRAIVGANRLTKILTDIGKTVFKNLVESLYLAEDLDDARRHIAAYQAQHQEK